MTPQLFSPAFLSSNRRCQSVAQLVAMNRGIPLIELATAHLILCHYHFTTAPTC